MKAITRRLRRLENQVGLSEKPRERFVVVVSALARPLNLAGSICRRMLCANGSITELVHLDGTRNGLSDEELEQFIEGFPIEPVA
jgi:hypothetical protein